MGELSSINLSNLINIMKAVSLLLVSTAMALSACSPNVQTRGHVKAPEWQAAIQPGVAGRQEVLEVLGSPSTRSSFGQETWYYITTKREYHAFFKPKVADQDVLAITFDTSGTVEQVEQLGKDALQEVDYSSRETPTAGHELTFMEQLLGNMGRFNRPEDSSTRGVGSNRPGGR